MSIIFNNLRKDILGDELRSECDKDVEEILKKQIEIYKLEKKLSTAILLSRAGITQQIRQLSSEIDVLRSKRDISSNTRTSEYLLSPVSDLSGYDGRFLCNFDKRGRTANTQTIINQIYKDYNIIKLGKGVLDSHSYNECRNRDLSQAEKNIIANDRNVDISNVEMLCSNLRKNIKLRDISDSLRSSTYWFTMYTQKEYVLIEFQRLFNTDIELREEIITNVKKFIDDEFERWRTLVSGWRRTNAPWTEIFSVNQGIKRKLSQFVYGDMNNFTQLTNYLTENVNKPEYRDLYTTIRNRRPNISSNITILNPLWEFYSAYPTDMTNQEFSQKNYIWLTPEIAQSLLYILGDKYMIQPVIFKFKFKRPLILLNPQTQQNTDISGMFLTRDGLTQAQFNAKTDKINKILGDLTGGGNSKILYFIDAINKLINDENYRIDGYRNRRDQNEIAVVDLSSVIDKNSIVKGRFEKVIIKNTGPSFPKEVLFPFNPPAKKLLISEKDISGHYIRTGTWNSEDSKANCPVDVNYVMYSLRYRRNIIMRQEKGAQYTLYYRWENELASRKFDCLDNKRDDHPQYVNDV